MEGSSGNGPANGHSNQNGVDHGSVNGSSNLFDGNGIHSDGQSNGTGDYNTETYINNNHDVNISNDNHADPPVANYVSQEGMLSSSNGSRLSAVDLPAAAPGLRRYGLNASIRQLHYSENKMLLDNLINQTVNLVYDLIKENKLRPIFYPTNFEDLKSGIYKTNKSLNQIGKEKMSKDKLLQHDKQIQHRQAQLDELEEAEFKVLKLNLQLSHNDLTNGLNSLDKSSISVLLEQKLNQQVKFLLNLKDRIDDTASKVFVTGDLNAGKSSLCNALLRRKLLPEDQQPCTSVFCEIIDASKDNNSIEEVHAIASNPEIKYNIKDEASYEIFPLQALTNLVYESDKYSLLKVYVNDIRPKDQSLLRNGVIDIRLIDAPGLNIDLYQTTQVFSRQEEIDLIIFVLNSENHFTLSGKEFITSTSNEKQYLFIVSNKFDNIKDKDRCKKKILDQVKGLSPASYKDAKNFVHFVSSNEVLEKLNDGDGDGDGGGDDPDDDDDDFINNPDFENLEASLRKFVLEKRAVSKLLPAKSYLLNILNDIKKLCIINEILYTEEKETLMNELNQNINPNYDDIVSKSVQVSDSILRLTENCCNNNYQFTKNELNDSINKLGDQQIIKYLGIQYAYDYAKETQIKMVRSIISVINYCEENAKISTNDTVNEIIKLGENTLGKEFLNDKTFQSDLMFSRKRDITAKSLYQTIELSDFFDPSVESFLMWIGLPDDLVSKNLNHLSNYNPTSIITKLPLTAITLREQLPTQITLHTLYASTKVLTCGAVIRRLYAFSHLVTPSVLKKISGPLLLGVFGLSVYYLINDIPNAFPRKQARKLKHQIEELDYIHNNADRIAKECRKVLNYPNRLVMNNFQTNIDKKNNEKFDTETKINNSNLSLSYFTGLKNRIDNDCRAISRINLEINTVD